MRRIVGGRNVVALLVLALLTALVISGPTLPAAAQEDSDQQSQDMPAEAQPADAQPPAQPSSGPGSDQPWYQWDMPDISPADQGFGLFVYQSFWDLRVAALENPDIDGELNLRGVMDGDPLSREVDFLHTLETKGQAQKVEVRHRPKVVYADGDQFVILDSYLDRSYLIDAKTRQPVAGPPPTESKVVDMAYHLRKVEEGGLPGYPLWKVVDSIGIQFVGDGS